MLIDEIAAINWYHRMDLGGIITPGIDDTQRKLGLIGMPADLKGQTVLDIGASDGAFSFEAERRGGVVSAIDTHHWQTRGKQGFNLAHRINRSQVLSWECDVMDLSPHDGQFDLVLFLGVLYHLRNPLEALDRVCAACRGMLILETHTDLWWVRSPAMRFYPGRELNGEPTNWWGPNVPAVLAMVKEVGFTRVKVHCRYRARWRRNRLVVHAWR